MPNLRKTSINLPKKRTEPSRNVDRPTKKTYRTFHKRRQTFDGLRHTKGPRQTFDAPRQAFDAFPQTFGVFRPIFDASRPIFDARQSCSSFAVCLSILLLLRPPIDTRRPDRHQYLRAIPHTISDVRSFIFCPALDPASPQRQNLELRFAFDRLV